jgi:ubiquinone/menaquinone biosynthesis C-methylase UbiE
VSVEHWETFYRGGALATCPTGPDANYSLDIREAWIDFFAKFPAGARVLDIGTGNGAVALIARDAATAADRKLEIHGSDLALIDPPRQVRGGQSMFDGITFHPGVATERLPFETASVDGVSAQFALEYTNVSDSLREIHRVLKPGGRARFSVHHAESVVVWNAQQSLSQAHLVLDETRIYRRLRAFVAAEREPASRARVAGAWNELNGAATQLQQALATTDTAHVLQVTLDAVRKLLAARRQMSPPQLDLEIDHVEREVRASVRRLQDLIRAARSPADIEKMVQDAASVGFETTAPQAQIQSGNVLVAWLLDIRKP